MLQNKCDTEKESISDLYLVGINVEAYGTDLQLVWRGANMGQNQNPTIDEEIDPHKPQPLQYELQRRGGV